jgi:hypothetical protein
VELVAPDPAPQTTSDEVAMNTIYNSPHYCVVEFSGFGDEILHPAGGYEIMDKGQRREIFLGGEQAASFRQTVQALIASEPTFDEVDAFLGGFSGIMNQPVTLH